VDEWFVNGVSGQHVGTIFKVIGLLDPWRWDKPFVPKRR